MMKNKGKLLLAGGLFLSLLAGCSVADGSETYSYEFDWKNVDGGIELTGINYNKENKRLDVTIPNRILGKKVVAIAEDAFKGVSAIRSVVFRENLKTVGKNAFANCSNLSAITINSAATITFEDNSFENTGLEKISVPAHITLKNGVFKNSQKLTSFTSVSNTYGSEILSGCNNLNSINVNFVGANAETYADVSYLFGTTIPASLKSVTITEQETFANTSFSNLSSVTSIILPNNKVVKNLPEGLFAACSSIQTVKLPFVGKTTFDETMAAITADYSLAYLFGAADNSVLPETLTTVNFHPVYRVKEGDVEHKYGQYAFYKANFENAANITTIKMDTGVETIHDNAFDGCTKLENITLSSSLKRIGKNAFKATKYYANKTAKNNSLVTLGNWVIGVSALQQDGTDPVALSNTSVTAVADGAFENITTEFTVSLKNVKTFGSNVFTNATGLKEVVDINLLTNLPASTFEGCTNLEKISMTRVTEIGARAFYGCTSLEAVSLERVVTVNESAFENCTSLSEITLSASLKNVAKNAFLNTNLTTLTLTKENQTTVDALNTLIEDTTNCVAEGNASFINLISNYTLPEAE